MKYSFQKALQREDRPPTYQAELKQASKLSPSASRKSPPNYEEPNYQSNPILSSSTNLDLPLDMPSTLSWLEHSVCEAESWSLSLESKIRGIRADHQQLGDKLQALQSSRGELEGLLEELKADRSSQYAQIL